MAAPNPTSLYPACSVFWSLRFTPLNTGQPSYKQLEKVAVCEEPSVFGCSVALSRSIKRFSGWLFPDTVFKAPVSWAICSHLANLYASCFGGAQQFCCRVDKYTSTNSYNQWYWQWVGLRIVANDYHLDPHVVLIQTTVKKEFRKFMHISINSPGRLLFDGKTCVMVEEQVLKD